MTLSPPDQTPSPTQTQTITYSLTPHLQTQQANAHNGNSTPRVLQCQLCSSDIHTQPHTQTIDTTINEDISLRDALSLSLSQSLSDKPFSSTLSPKHSPRQDTHGQTHGQNTHDYPKPTVGGPSVAKIAQSLGLIVGVHSVHESLVSDLHAHNFSQTHGAHAHIRASARNHLSKTSPLSQANTQRTHAQHTQSARPHTVQSARPSQTHTHAQTAQTHTDEHNHRPSTSDGQTTKMPQIGRRAVSEHHTHDTHNSHSTHAKDMLLRLPSPNTGRATEREKAERDTESPIQTQTDTALRAFSVRETTLVLYLCAKTQRETETQTQSKTETETKTDAQTGTQAETQTEKPVTAEELINAVTKLHPAFSQQNVLSYISSDAFHTAVVRVCEPCLEGVFVVRCSVLLFVV